MMRVPFSPEGIHQGPLVLVNGRWALPGQGGQDLCPVPASGQGDREMNPALSREAVTLNRLALAALTALVERVGGWGSILAVSGWRPREEQQAIWQDTVAQRGLDFARTYVARPGHSEHQSGWAVDLALNQPPIDFISPAFPYRGVCQALRRRAPAYGFVERYPAGKEMVTGIGHEPWHFRYVGVPHGQIMTGLGLTLEEYLDFLRGFPHGKRAYRWAAGGVQALISYVGLREAQQMPPQLGVEEDYEISGDNREGFILTQWMDAGGGTAGGGR